MKPEVKVYGAPALIAAMNDYRAQLGKSALQATAKASREATFALFEEFRQVRPGQGQVAREAEARGFRMSYFTPSWDTGYKSARKILGGAKSGYFRINRSGGSPTAEPIIVGRRGAVVTASRKNLSTLSRNLATGKGPRGGSLLTDWRQLRAARRKEARAYASFQRKYGSGSNGDTRGHLIAKARLAKLQKGLDIPSDAVRLNVTALANLRAVNLRDRAGRGGYLAAQFLTYKKIKATQTRASFLTKNNLNAGEVIIEDYATGPKAIVVGRLPGTAKVAERHGIVPRALQRGANEFRRDMLKKIAERAARRASA